MQSSPDSPLTLPKQEEGSTSSFDGAVEEGRFIDDVKPDGAGKLTYSGKEIKSLLYSPNCIYNYYDLKVIDLL